MKNLHDLLQATHELTKHGLYEKSASTGSAHPAGPYLTDRLEFQVSHGFIQSYDEMEGHLYRDVPITENALYQVVHRVKEKNRKRLFTEDLSHRFRNEYDKKRYQVQRDYVLAETMILKGFSQAGWALMQKLLPASKKYSLTFYSCVIAQKLAYYYMLNGRLKAYRTATLQVNSQYRLVLAEKEADGIFCELSLLMINRWHFEERIKSKALRCFRRMKEIIRYNRSHNLWLAFYRIAIYYHYTCENYQGLLDITRKFRKYLVKNPHLQQDARWAELAHHEMNACLALRNFVYGLHHAEESKKFLHANNHNWMLYMENYFQLLMHAGLYERAREVYQEVSGSRYWRRRTEPQREIWKIKQAYLHFALNDARQIELFMPARFLNEITELKKDKKGLNFVLQVAEFMYLLAQEKDERLIEFGESFRLYVSRHISRRRHYRGYYFTRLLLTLYKYNFDIDKAERIGKKFLARLMDYRRYTSHDRELTELIPYENLWIMILRVMKKRRGT